MNTRGLMELIDCLNIGLELKVWLRSVYNDGNYGAGHYFYDGTGFGFNQLHL
jgi:hypothetical protein